MNKHTELVQKLNETRAALAAALNMEDAARAELFAGKVAALEIEVANHERQYMARNYRKAVRASK